MSCSTLLCPKKLAWFYMELVKIGIEPEDDVNTSNEDGWSSKCDS